MYLITVARATEEGRSGPVPLALIADTLAVSVASANEMVRKLARRGLIAYEPYRGVELTGDGHAIANRVLRTRRLWGTFLADHLGLSPRAADDQACHLEHVTTPDSADRLAEFLGDPEADPLGLPIPGPWRPSTTVAPPILLSETGAGEIVEVVSVAAPRQAATFLADQGIVPGARVSIAGIATSGILIESGGPVALATRLAQAIAVRRIEQADDH